MRGPKGTSLGAGLALAAAACVRPGDGAAPEPAAGELTEPSASSKAEPFELKLPPGAEPRAEELAAGCMQKDAEACLKLGVAFRTWARGYTAAVR